MARLFTWLIKIVVWFRHRFFASATALPLPALPPPKSKLEPAPESAPEPATALEPAPTPELEPVSALEPLPLVAAPIMNKPAKWVKPKGEVPKAEPKPKTEPKPKGEPRPKAPRPQLRTEDPEQWGQYYFRDAILDQLDTYFIYLRRMKKTAKDAYDLHSRLGIQIMPQSAVQSFDKWRSNNEDDQLSAWWKDHRPTFGAVSYGIDAVAIEEESIGIADLSPEQWKLAKYREGPIGRTHRIATITGGPQGTLSNGEHFKTGLIWIPKFLYFMKWSKPPAEVQKVADGDVYKMAIYFDRTSGHSKTFHKHHKHGVPQEFAVHVERATGKVRILRTLTHEMKKIASKKEPGGSFKIPQKQWGYPIEHIAMACGRLDMCPEDYVCRIFMEAALMYESSSLGSMIRVAVTKGKLTATFGVEIKRTAYFFKDRDVVLNASGSRKRIFHIVRPHTRKDGTVVPMHFRGEREFEWAGYKVAITVPGRDHWHLIDFDVGMLDEKDALKKFKPNKLLNTAQLGDRLNNDIRIGKGAWQK